MSPNGTNKTWEFTDTILKNDYDNNITTTGNVVNFYELEQRIQNVEKLLKKIEAFLNKFFDTDINKEKNG